MFIVFQRVLTLLQHQENPVLVYPLIFLFSVLVQQNVSDLYLTGCLRPEVLRLLDILVKKYFYWYKSSYQRDILLLDLCNCLRPETEAFAALARAYVRAMFSWSFDADYQF